MKSFLKKIVTFTLLSLIAILILVFGSNLILKHKSSFKISKNIDKVFLGHSHSECSINDSIFKNSINLSSSGESYFYNYQKIRKLIDQNSHIKTVFVEFTNNNVDSIMDDWIWGYDKMAFYLQFYTPFMKSKDLELLVRKNSTDFIASYSIATRKHLYRVFRGNFDFINDVGGFMNAKESKVNQMISENFFDRTISKEKSVSETNLMYLRKMIDLCHENGIKLFLIRSPQHPLHPDLENEHIYQKILNQKFKDVELLDFDEMNFPNDHYLDLHHLNYKGAKHFSELFNNLIENNLLNSENKQSEIDKGIKKFNTNYSRSIKDTRD